MADVEDDPQSVQILGVARPSARDAWREAGSSSQVPVNQGRVDRGRARWFRWRRTEMTRAYALSLLGLEEGATEAEIRAAHKRLMLAIRTVAGLRLAAQINRANILLQTDELPIPILSPLVRLPACLLCRVLLAGTGTE